jgi:hypothetical protein
VYKICGNTPSPHKGEGEKYQPMSWEKMKKRIEKMRKNLKKSRKQERSKKIKGKSEISMQNGQKMVA